MARLSKRKEFVLMEKNYLLDLKYWPCNSDYKKNGS